jgi:hypothetical protein
LRGFLAYPGKMFQFINKAFNWSGEIRHVLCVAHPRARAQIFDEKNEERNDFAFFERFVNTISLQS